MQALKASIYNITIKTARNTLHCVFDSTHSGIYHINESVKFPVTDTMVAAKAMFITRFVKGRKEGGPVSLRDRKRETPRRFTPESRRETKVYSGLASAGVIRETTRRCVMSMLKM